MGPTNWSCSCTCSQQDLVRKHRKKYCRINHQRWPKKNNIDNPIQLVASGSHRTEKDEIFAEALGPHVLIRMGSSLKACIVADGSAHLYPRFGPTSCWDIAAAHAVVSAAGGILVGPDAQNLRYDILDKILNPHFLVACSSHWNNLWINNQG